MKVAANQGYELSNGSRASVRLPSRSSSWSHRLILLAAFRKSFLMMRMPSFSARSDSKGYRRIPHFRETKLIKPSG
ncbi:MAG: hypothetical protein C4294_09610 [Nitrospiraceae bacterium]